MRCLSLLACFAMARLALASVVVDEPKVRAGLRDGRTEVTLPIESSEVRSIRATVFLEWLDPADHPLEKADREVTISPGANSITLPLTLEGASIWTRLRYTVTPARADAAAMRRLRGILALPAIAPHVFELRASLGGTPRRGQPLIVHAQALHPLTRQPLSNIDWSAELEEAKPTSIAPLLNGAVELRFSLPAKLDESGDIDITARLGDFEQDVSLDFRLLSAPSATIQTDKPIYQPGQTIHFRAIVLDPAGRAAANAKTTLQIDNAEGDRAFTKELTASKFGVVQADFRLPATAETGQYDIRLLSDGEQKLAQHAVRVSRYDLPSFRVEVRLQSSAFLPGRPAIITVSAQYLFGKPVPNGKVKIVRGDDTIALGETAPDGTFRTVIDVSRNYKHFPEGGRFQDISFAAHVLEPLSGRTEQRRFDVRISREALHVYLLPIPETALGYISTYAADGRPVSAKVEMTLNGQTTKAQTNKYGVARVPLGFGEEARLRAVDTAGRTGTARQWIYQRAPNALKLKTAKTLHVTGESVTLQLVSPTPETQIFVHALVDNQRIATRVARVRAGRAEVTFPFQPEFRRTVVFVAEDAFRAVLFPDSSDLQITAAPEHSIYRPGESASLQLRVLDSARQPIQAALGVAVVDQAVMERARTDEEFGTRRWFACAYCRDDAAEIGGVHLSDLYRAKPTPELDLVAEALVARETGFSKTDASEDWRSHPTFGSIRTQSDLIERRLRDHYARTLEFPRDLSTFSRHINLAEEAFADPWGTPYSPAFGTVGENYTITLQSAGPDKRHGTEDDFTAATLRSPYFLPLSRLISDALTKQQDYPANTAELAALLRSNGLVLETLRDPWGHPYRAQVQTWSRTRYVQLFTNGPDGKPNTRDDTQLANFRGDYFRRESSLIDTALQAAATPPQTRAAFAALVANAGVNLTLLRDAWGHPYRIESATRSEYWDQSNTRTVQEFGQPARTVTDRTPVTRKVNVFSLRSSGGDGKPGTYDDFNIASFPVVLQTATGIPQPTPAPGPAMARGTGTLSGTVLDATGAAIANAKVVLVNAALQGFETTSAADGSFHFISVPPGVYSLRADSPGFQRFELTRIPIDDGRATNVEVQLQVGSVAEAVSVTAEAPELQTSASSAAAPQSVATATPRLRDYFPETLLWLPEIETDASGQVRIPVKLADNITTWKVAVIASTLDGKSAEAAAEIRAFQPFFLDLDPPAVLTTGDRVDLPITVRNYEDQPQSLDLKFEWSQSEPAARQIAIKPNAAVNVSYPLTVTQWRDKASVRVTAHKDAIEKPIRLRPDGQFHSQTLGDILTGSNSLILPIPAAAIPEANQGELRLYPSFAALLLESAEAIVQTPHGCAEQLASAGFANLIAWRFTRATGHSQPKVEANALANIRLAVETLADRIGKDGGVRYWSSSPANVAVTAHVLQFLVEASAYTPVDADQLVRTARWLAAQQQSNGLWPAESHQSPLLLTATVARALAAVRKAGVAIPEGALTAAYHHLANFTATSDEPYMLAQYTLALLDSGDEKLIGNAVTRLVSLAHTEKGAQYWDLHSNTPYYGWGFAGRLETTALVVNALAAWRAAHTEATPADSAMRAGLVFLLRNRDRWGGWYSTQATVRAMRAVALFATAIGGWTGRGEPVTIHVNGHALPPLPFEGIDLVRVDLSAHLRPGDNRIELTGGAGALLRLTGSHWLPWPQAQPRTAPELRYSVKYSRLQSSIGDLVRCTVEAERIGFRGFGMMLAEVALPPGVEADRASLEKLPVNNYEVLADRVVFYLWPKAGGMKFDFLVRPRMAMTAKSGTSVLYDYYNPESITEVPPVLWTVR